MGTCSVWLASMDGSDTMRTMSKSSAHRLLFPGQGQLKVGLLPRVAV